MIEELKKVCKERNLKGKIRAAKSGCLDLCAFGPNIMIWPEGIWFMKVAKEDIPQIVDTYLKLEEADKKPASAAQGEQP
jgi:(2Fe-2S) ferredoxin